MEELGGPTEVPKNPFGRVLWFLSLIAGLIVVAVTFYTVADVVMRYVFNSPFRSSLEFTQFMMAAIVFLSLAYCGWTGGHVAVDIFVQPLEKPGLNWIPPLLTLISAILFAAIAWYSLKEGLETMHRLSNMLRWPHFPFILITAAGSALYAIVLFVQAIQGFRSLGRSSLKQQ
jgi:TRAP-type C4-dicarboxylate transport system permease small subunit